jgi:hypothetical protein
LPSVASRRSAVLQNLEAMPASIAGEQRRNGSHGGSLAMPLGRRSRPQGSLRACGEVAAREQLSANLVIATSPQGAAGARGGNPRSSPDYAACRTFSSGGQQVARLTPAMRSPLRASVDGVLHSPSRTGQDKDTGPPDRSPVWTRRPGSKRATYALFHRSQRGGVGSRGCRSSRL